MTPTSNASIGRANDVAVRLQLAGDRHRAALAAFLDELSPASAYLRFFGADPRPTPRLINLLACHDADHLSAVATVGGQVIGHAMLARRPHVAGAPELAVVVADAWQHHGLGPQLVRHLLGNAGCLVESGVEFTILADNLHANAVAQHLWPLATMALDHGVMTYRAPIETPAVATGAPVRSVA